MSGICGFGDTHAVRAHPRHNMLAGRCWSSRHQYLFGFRLPTPPSDFLSLVT